jgi:hypothetical protein
VGKNPSFSFLVLSLARTGPYRQAASWRLVTWPLCTGALCHSTRGALVLGRQISLLGWCTWLVPSGARLVPGPEGGSPGYDSTVGKMGNRKDDAVGPRLQFTATSPASLGHRATNIQGCFPNTLAR